MLGSAAILWSITHAPAATDKEFIKAAVGINLAEIAAGQMATEKGHSDDVKDFGRMLVDDHRKANEEANRLATEMNITAPSEPSSKAQKQGADLASLTGVEFDAAFADQMVSGHEQAIALFEDKADDGTNEASKFAEATLPGLRKHLQTA